VFEASYWPFEIVANFKEIIFWMTGALFLLALFSKKKPLAIALSGASLVFCGVSIIPFYWNSQVGTSNPKVINESPYRLVFANINSQNLNKQMLVEYVSDLKPDILMLAEASPEWESEIKILEQDLPHLKGIFLDSNFGLAVLSRIPIQSDRVFLDRANTIPALLISFKSASGPLNVAVLHAFPPLGWYGTISKNQYIRGLAQQLGELDGPLIACGDFNTSPWLKTMLEFSQISRLRLPGTPIGTWPAFPFIPKLPIDSCWTRHVEVINYARGRDIGSDHYPLVLEFVLKHD